MIVLSTDSLRGYGLNRIFELAKKAGYEGIDLSVNYGQFDTYNEEYLKQLIQEYNIPIQSISAPNQMASKNIKQLINMAKELNVKVVILQPPKFLDFKLSSWLKKEIPKLRETNKMSIALENAPAGTLLGILPGHALSNTQDMKKFKHIALDTARIGEKREDLIRTYSSFKKYLVHIHLSDLHLGKKYGIPGEGILPLESLLTKLKQDSYPGAISIKILPKHLHAGNDEKVVEELVKIKKYYDKYYTNVKALEEENESDEDKMTGM